MSLIEKFIHRPVLTTALSIFILLLGLFGLITMPLRFLPEMEQAVIDIQTTYSGADTQTVKGFVTTKIQNAIVGVDGIDYLSSSSATGVSHIKIYLLPGKNADVALTNIIEKVNSIRGDLPREVDTPVISKQNADNRPILILGFSSEKLKRADAADYLRRVIAPQLEAIEGVSQIQVWGDPYVMQIWLNPDALTAYHLSPQDVVNALRSQNVLASPGKTQGKYFNYTLNATTALHTAEEFNQLVIKVVNNVPIYLKDVGEARTGERDEDFMVYYNAKPTTMLGVSTLPTSNPITVVNAILKNLPRITQNMPSDLSMHVVLNRTLFINNSLHEVIKTLIESMIIVIIVLFLFLGNIRAALIPAITIPLSLIGVCFLMSILGYSINTITLLAMVLAVGLVVDDAIVVVENIVRHLSATAIPIQSTIIATRELVVPVIAMTITLAAVYLPIGFTSGLIGQLFKEFSFTLAGSVIISGLIALTLSPMMGARFIRAEQQPQFFSRWIEKIMYACQEYYRRLLIILFKYKKWMMLAWLLVVIAAVIFYVKTPSELAPTENQGFLLVVGEAPASANRAYLEQYAAAAHQIFQQNKTVDDYATVLSPDEGYTSYLISQRQTKQQPSLLAQMKPLQIALENVTGLSLRTIAPSIFGGGGPPIQFVLQSTENYKDLYYMAKLIEEKAMQSGMFMYLFDNLNYSKPEASIVVDSNAAAAANVSMENIASALSSLMSNRQVQQFSANDQSYDVVIKTLPQYQLNPEDLQTISVPTNHQSVVPLSSVASLRYHVMPTAMNQFQKMNSVTIMGNVLPGRTISEGLKILNQLAAENLPKQMTMDYAGSSRQFLQEGNRMLTIFVLAMLVIFLILSMQFESYRDSLIILLGSVPMALFAALLPLKYGLGSINIYTQIGLLTLVGLISKHGILITRFANEIRAEKKLDKEAAVIEAAILRFRPILMTTAAILFGALPLINASGAGSESRYAIGMVIGFGMGIGTLLTLLLLPVLYTVFVREK